jgi:hypothetical protein
MTQISNRRAPDNCATVGVSSLCKAIRSVMVACRIASAVPIVRARSPRDCDSREPLPASPASPRSKKAGYRLSATRIRQACLIGHPYNPERAGAFSPANGARTAFLPDV